MVRCLSLVGLGDAVRERRDAGGMAGGRCTREAGWTSCGLFCVLHNTTRSPFLRRALCFLISLCVSLFLLLSRFCFPSFFLFLHASCPFLTKLSLVAHFIE
jgi:hypothetical protein